ncbi:hypothetical protein BDV11DRAFT_169154 [Aspergillus similis]
MSQASTNPQVGPQPQAGGTSPAGAPQAGNDNPWVLKIIEDAANPDNFKELKSRFLSSDCDMNAATEFFRQINLEIEKQNIEHHVEMSKGIIHPANKYETLFEQLEDGIREKPYEEHPRLLNDINQLFKEFNQKHHLPAGWVIPESMLFSIQQKILAEFDENDPSDTSVKSEDDMRDIDSVPPFQGGQGSPPAVTIEDELVNLDSLEEVTRNTMLSYSNGEALFWWKRGTGSQVFMRYGTAEHPIYRIRAGSYEPYDPKKVPQILSIQRGGRGAGWTEMKREEQDGMSIAQPRGHLKVITEDNDGEFQEDWMYKRSDVAGILGVGWKVEDDDDEKEEPLDCLWPESGDEVAYPFTRILVKWTDQMITLEDRSFIRRIKKGPTRLADMLIYHKALSSEVLYRQQQGIPYEHLLEDLRSLKTDRRKRTPGVVHGIMPISESPDPSLPLPRQATSQAPAIRFSTPGAPQRSTPAAARGHTPGRMGQTPQPMGMTPGRAGSAPTHAERFSSMLHGRPSAPATTSDEDPRDAQIRELQAQLSRLQLAMNQQQPRYNLRSQQQMLAPPWGNPIPAELSGYPPEPTRGRKSRGRKGRGQPPNWNYWAGQYAMPGPAYYSY